MIECPTCGSNNTDQAQRCGKCASPLLGTDLRCGLYTYGGTSNGQVLQMRYIITRELSSDVTGVKYLAEDAQEKKNVIIWALPVVAAVDREKIRSLSELCNRLKILTDEHILKVSGFYSKNDARYFVTEYVDGCSLEEKVASVGPLNLKEVLEIFSPLAHSIDLAHRQGFIHGDISPANILTSPKGVVKLANFAIGKAIKEMLAMLFPEEDIKPSFYTAPEQLENGICSAHSDIYSLASCISRSLCNKSDRQNKVLRRALSANPKDRHNSASELLTELRNSADEMIAETDQTESGQIGYEKSLADLRQRTREWSRELEETINTLTAGAEREKQKQAEILRQAQAQHKQQAEQLRADYEGKIEQLKAKIAQTQAELAAALSEVDRKTKTLVAEKENALRQSREYGEAINKLIADAELEKQKHAEMLSKAQAQIREQAEQQLAEYEEKIVQLKTKIADTELAAVAALGQPQRNNEALAAEKAKALQQSREHEEAIRKLIADAEKEKRQHLDVLSQTQTQVRQQAEQQIADYEDKINRLKARVEEAEVKLAAAVSEADRKAGELSAEKERALKQSREYEKVIKKLSDDFEKEKHILAETLSNAQIQPREQTVHGQTEYEEKIKQLEARIAETEAKFADAVREADWKTEKLAVEKEKLLQQCREYEEAVKILSAGIEKEKHLLADTLRNAQVQPLEQQTDYDEKIKQLEAGITEAEAKLAAAVSEANQKAGELAEEKQKALQQKGEYEEAIKILTADAEKEKQQHLEILNNARTQTREQLEQQRADCEKAIEQLKAKIADTQTQLAAALSQAEQKTGAMADEKENVLQRCREYEGAVKKLTADIEKEKQAHLEILNQVRVQAREQAEQQRADYEKKIEQLKGAIADAQLAAAMNEADRYSVMLAAEKEKSLQKSREYEEAIKKLIEDAEKEKQILADTLSQAKTQVRGQTEQQRADYEKRVEQLKMRITETEAELAAALKRAHRNSEVLASEKQKALQKCKEYEETLEKVKTDTRQQKYQSVEQLMDKAHGNNETQAGAIKEKAEKTSTKFKVLLIAFTSVSIVTFGIVTGYLHIQGKKQNNHSLKQQMASVPSAKQEVNETPAKSVGPLVQNNTVKNEPERNVPKKTFSELTREAVELEGNNQWEEAIVVYEKALKINKIARIENRVRICWYNLYLSQATAAQAEDLDKAIELYGKALTYNDTADVREKLEAAKKTQRTLTQLKPTEIELQKWLETAF